MCAERRWDADDDDVAIGQAVEVRRGGDVLVGEGLGDPLAADVANVGLAAIEHLGLFGIDVETEHRKACLFKEQNQRQADVAETDDADARGAGADRVEQRLKGLRFGRAGNTGLSNSACKSKRSRSYPS